MFHCVEIEDCEVDPEDKKYQQPWKCCNYVCASIMMGLAGIYIAMLFQGIGVGGSFNI